VRTLAVLSGTQRLLGVLSLLALFALPGAGQNSPKTPDSLQDSIQTLQNQANELKTMMEEMKAEILRSRAEAAALREELQATRDQLATTAQREKESSVQQDAQKLQEDQDLLKAKVEDQYQSKVESASRYRVRLSGIALVNMFSNNGTVDNFDFPTLALEDNSTFYRGGFGGSLRQSQLGVEAFGPEIRGGRISGDLQFDFAGGMPNLDNGVVLGLARLRTGVLHWTWPKTTLVAGQDVLFFSPLSPSSIASLAVPPFAYSGNLWSWTPQVRIEHRLDLANESSILLQGGILDSLTGDRPVSAVFRTPQAGEASGQPAYAMRTSWSRDTSDHSLVLGAGGYYGRQDWSFNRSVDSWAGTADWTIPAGNKWEVSGEFYRGRAIGGIGGGIGRTILASGPITDPRVRVKGLNAEGGWTQIKFRQTSKFEWNGAFGMDTVPAKQLRSIPFSPDSYKQL
jgi:F0F1-type ATP synthase membrane subunit b/b'